MENLTLLKANIIGGLDNHIRETCDEDIVIDLWLALGMPDGETEEELMEDVNEYFVEWLGVAYQCLQLQDMRDKVGEEDND